MLMTKSKEVNILLWLC